MKTSKTSIYVIRHCEAEGNRNRTFQGHTDCGISEKGKLQLDSLAERFADVPLTALYSSPLQRAQSTAQAVNRHHSLDICIEPRIMEINGGVLEGVQWSRFPELYPEQSDNWIKRPYLFKMEGGEAMTEVYDRMSSAIIDIARQNEGGCVAVCTHGCAIRNLLCWAKGYPIERLAEMEWCDNTAVTLLEMENGQPHIIYERDNSHLTGEQSTFAGQSWWKEKDKPMFSE